MAPVLLEPTIVVPQPSTAPLKVSVNGTVTNGVDLTLKARPWRLLHLADALNPPPPAQEEHPDIYIQRLLQLAWVTTRLSKGRMLHRRGSSWLLEPDRPDSHRSS